MEFFFLFFLFSHFFFQFFFGKFRPEKSGTDRSEDQTRRAAGWTPELGWKAKISTKNNFKGDRDEIEKGLKPIFLTVNSPKGEVNNNVKPIFSFSPKKILKNGLKNSIYHEYSIKSDNRVIKFLKHPKNNKNCIKNYRFFQKTHFLFKTSQKMLVFTKKNTPTHFLSKFAFKTSKKWFLTRKTHFLQKIGWKH